MVFNHIEGNINIPGELPWELVAAYFIIAPIVLIYIS